MTFPISAKPVMSPADSPISIPLRELLHRVNRRVNGGVLSDAGPKNTSELDALINDSQKITSYLRTFRNSLTPINQLPPECIASISAAAYLQPGKRTPHSKVLQFGLVCKYWRDVTRSYAPLWTSMSDRQPPELWAITLERSKSAPLDVYLQRGSQDFMEILHPRVQRIRSLECRVRVEKDQRTGAIRTSPNFSRSSPILETLRLENEGKKDLPAETKLDILPENATSLRVLCLRHIPLTNQLLRLTTLISLELCQYSVDLTTLLDFLAANEGLRTLRVTCRKPPTQAPHRVVSLGRIHLVELSSVVVRPLLAALRIPPTADVSIQVLPGGSSYTPLHEVLPSSLDGLPVLTQTASLQYGVTETLGQVVSGSSPDRGTFNIQGVFNQSFPTDFRPLNVSGVRELCLSGAQAVPSLLLGEADYTALQILFSRMIQLDTLVLARQSAVERILSTIDAGMLLPRLSTLAITPLPHAAVDPLVQLAYRRRNNSHTSDLSCLEVQFFEHKSSSEITRALRRLEAVVPSVNVRMISWFSNIRFESVRKGLLPNGLFNEIPP